MHLEVRYMYVNVQLQVGQRHARPARPCGLHVVGHSVIPSPGEWPPDASFDPPAHPSDAQLIPGTK